MAQDDHARPLQEASGEAATSSAPLRTSHQHATGSNDGDLPVAAVDAAQGIHGNDLENDHGSHGDHAHGEHHHEDEAEDAAASERLRNFYHSKKDRVFVRSIQGAYALNEELARLRAAPRVRRAKEIRFVDGPQAYSRHYVEPKDGITQTFHLHLEEYGPGGASQKHGHVNEAAFYILDGEGYEIHDNIRYDWQAGDVAIVHNNCVHQHFNASRTKPARALVIKTKPMYLFMNMLFQKQVEPRRTRPAPGGEGFEAREAETDFNHPDGGY